MSSTLEVATGDIIFSNWVTVLGALAAKSGQKWGHVGMIVVLDEIAYVAEISLEQSRPKLIPLDTYLEDPRLVAVGIRKTRKSYGQATEDLIMTNITEMMGEGIHYPSIGEALARFMGAVRHDHTSICSEFVTEVLSRSGIVHGPGLGEHYKAVRITKGGREQTHEFSVILPDHLMPVTYNKGTKILDHVYVPTIVEVPINEHTHEQKLALLKDQCGILPHMLA